ncbi:MAG: outer membrane beta-barrel protein [Bacteroidales bacterium]|nr:outer membrane beta-barrel protein [Bacteroidales bacterium]
MKRLFLLIFGLISITATAQEKTNGLMAEFSFGSTRYGNYSAISAFHDTTATYSMIPTLQLSVGYRFADDWFLGVSAKYDGGNSSVRTLEEKFVNLGVMVDVRHYFPLSSRLELELGVAAGLLVHTNNFKYLGQNHSTSRVGFDGSFIAGIKYEFKPNHYIGIKASIYNIGILPDKPEDIPMGLTSNAGDAIIGHGLLCSYGVVF